MRLPTSFTHDTTALRINSVVLLICSVFGCTSTYQVTTYREHASEGISVQELQGRLEGRVVEIERQTGGLDSATDVVIGQHGWTTYASGSLERIQVRTSSIRRLSFRDHGRGLTEGMLLGTLAGGLGGVLIFPVLEPPPYHDVEALGAIVATIIGGAIGLVGGGAYGAVEGKKCIVDMGPPAQWSDSLQAGLPPQEESAGTRLPEWLRHFLRSNRLMLTGGFGPGGQLSGQDLIGIGYMNGPWQFVVRHYTGRTYPPSFTYPGLIFDEYQYAEWQFLAGISHEGDFHRVSASLGLSNLTLRTSHMEIPGNRSEHTDTVIGFPLEIRAILKLTSFIGLGVSAFHSSNARLPVSGILFMGEITTLR